MNSIKCGQCGFTNWATSENCKRCNVKLADNFQPSSRHAQKLDQELQTPSFFQIFKNDYFSFLGLILPLVGWGLYIAVAFFGLSFRSRSQTVVGGAGDAKVFFMLAAAFTLIGIGLTVWRVSSVQSIFKSGKRVMGKIIDVSFFKDRGRVEFSYIYNRQNFQCGLAIKKNSTTEYYRNGDSIVLIVDSNNPQDALIEELYVSKGFERI